MPTYTVHAGADAFTDAQAAALAKSITDLHSHHTGAPRSFVQTIFHPIGTGAHFVGGEPTDPRGVWIYGHVRSGRPTEVRTALVLGIRDATERLAGIPREFIWVYLNELTPSDMIEFGSVLPLPGHEAAWLDALPDDLRTRLLALDRP